ncbi:MAG TPA: hypothetical protein VEI01_21420 [Terriglobales bacterium]|jgi:hypothetical protein|nr:hypothetical protein [Terriglobales bacterium]
MRTKLLLCFAAGLISMSAATCVSQDNSSIDSDIQILRADIRSDKTKIMADQMQLSDTEGKAFWPIYNEYDQELSKLNDERVALLKEYANSYDTLTDQQVQSLADRSFALQKKRVDLRQKYFKKMSKAVSPKTAARFVQVEDRVDMLLNLQLAANLPMVQK